MSVDTSHTTPLFRAGHRSFERALAQRADGLLARWAPVLRVECFDPSILKDREPLPLHAVSNFRT